MSRVDFLAELDRLVADDANAPDFDDADRQSFKAFGPAICSIQQRLRRLALDVEALNALWDQSTQTAKNHLPNNHIMPNPTDLAGGDTLRKGQWQTLLNYANQLRGDEGVSGQFDLAGDTVFPLMVSAAGLNVQGLVAQIPQGQ